MQWEQVRSLLLNGQLVSPQNLAELEQRFGESCNGSPEGDAFLDWLVQVRVISDFQAVAMRAGVSGPYQLGPYRITSRVVAGRLGDVFRAEHVEFAQPVSLKVFPDSVSRDALLLARIGREIRVALEVDHPNVIKTYHIGRKGNWSYIALEELVGETLEQRLAREVKLPFETACQLIYQAAVGLAHVHSRDIVHRDICPANLWITSREVVKVMEFGAARDALAFLDSSDGGNLTLSGDPASVLGNYDYMCAEQAQDPHAATCQTDLYSLGCVLYRCLTGVVPFADRNPVRQMLRHASEVPQSLSACGVVAPVALQAIVDRLLAKQPSDRFATASELATSLAGIVPMPESYELDPVNADFALRVQAGPTLEESAAEASTDDEEKFESLMDFLTSASERA